MNHTFSAPLLLHSVSGTLCWARWWGWHAPRSMNPKRRTLTAYWLPVCGWRLTPGRRERTAPDD